MRVLVAGAGGVLGKQVTRELVCRGHPVRALVRQTPLPDDLAALVDTRRCDALDPSQLVGLTDDVDVVFSCVGASVLPLWGRGRHAFERVDTPANLNLIAMAREGGVRRFVYVGVAGHRELGHLRYVRAHELVVAALRTSGLEPVIVRPHGLFAAFEEILTMARAGRVPIVGDGSARANPVHEADVADVCVDAIEGSTGDAVIGGPDVLTRRNIVELAYEKLRKPVRVRTIPPGLARAMAPVVRPLSPRLADLTEFYVEVGTRDLVVPAIGTRRLADYFGMLAA